MNSAVSDSTARPIDIARAFKQPQPSVVETIDPADLHGFELANNGSYVSLPSDSHASPVLYVGEPLLVAALGPSITRDVSKAIVEEAESHVGYREGRKNQNIFSEYYGRPPEMWCADFASNEGTLKRIERCSGMTASPPFGPVSGAVLPGV